MNKVLLHWFFALSAMLLSIIATATHNRAGEITYEHVSGLTYRVTITTYTKESAVADRPWLKIRWGDEPANVEESQLDSLAREEPPTIISSLDTQINVYYGEHTYAGPGSFTIAVEDPNRNAGILNINNGGPDTPEDEKTSTSVMAVFAISTNLIINPGLDGHNNSVVLTKPPTDMACINQIWEHNPGAYDPDGDVLVYSLVNCLGQGGLPLIGWESPVEYTDDNSDTFIINSATGDITWDRPLVAGEYNIAILIEEYRDGVLVGSVLRDMQITVVNCANQPPLIADLPDYCIDAGSTLTIPVSFSDPNGDNVTVTPYSGILSEVVNDAFWNPNTTTLTWNPQCEEVRSELYYVTFSATDNGFPNLTNIETVSIRVVAPRVENPVATASGNAVTLTWDVTPCIDIFPSYEIPFVSYKIYRHQGFVGFIPDQCETGVPESTGYIYVGTVDGANSNSFVDNDVVYGGQYCYMVVTVWPDGAESYASAEACVEIRKEAAVMIKASIGITDVAIGNDTIMWSAPYELDTLLFLPPYKYRLLHGTGLGYPNDVIYTSPEFTFLAQGDTSFIHENINTFDGGHNYRVEFISQDVVINSSATASSIFLQPIPGDNQITLNMVRQTPWFNYQYTIFRKAPGESEFSFYDVSSQPIYVDDSLINNEVYCYRVLAFGTYGATGVPDLLINWSQEVCSRPYDMTPPCAPEIAVDHDCAAAFLGLTWNNPNESCANDVTAYNVYYSPIEGQPLEVIATLDGAGNINYVYEDLELPVSIAGCYAVTALDSLNLWPDGQLYQNESELSNIICIDNCPIYFLPNIFSPNGDGKNDYFIPFEYRYIESIDLKIYNRWGNVVFETTDPAIEWNGVNKDSGEVSADGVYYYTIRVNTIRLSGIVTEDFSGSIQLRDGAVGNSDGQ